MIRKLDSPIVRMAVLDEGKGDAADQAAQRFDAVTPTLADVVQMHEKVQRPAKLHGTTYKLKTPLSEHSLYVTINDIVLNEGTEHELRRPFEVFINSKNMDHFQWIVALTRIISAVFRKGGDVAFLVEELHSVFDPRGGYLKKGGRFVPSLVAEIGDVLKTHLLDIGLLAEAPDRHRDRYLAEKREALGLEARTADENDDGLPEHTGICRKCHNKAVVYLDGCLTCLSCGDSRCG